MNWNSKAKRILKSELAKREITHEELAHLLNELEVYETKASIDSKVSRGTFSATFFIQCLYAIGCQSIVLEDALDFVSEPLNNYRIKKSNKNDL